ncbi:WXG100 family type VII secretion target [Lentzea sp. NPDC055074]
MTGAFRIEPDQVRAGAGGFGVAAEMLSEAGGTLSSALSAQGACWGGDESGRQFSQDYVPAAEGTVKAFGQLSEAIQAIKTALNETANTHQDIDETSSGGLGAIGG